MDLVTLSLFVVLEVALLLGFAIVLLWRKHRLLHRQLRAQEDAAPQSAENFASIESGYLPYLEKEILATRSRLELSEAESGCDDALPVALQQRLTALEAEKKVIESCNDYPERQWEFVAAYFQPVASEPEDAVVEEGDDALAQARTRIQSLEKFRDNFFTLKHELDALEETRQELQSRLDELLPEAEHSEELQSLLDAMTGQQDKLQRRLEEMESQGGDSDSLAAASPAENSAAERIDELHGVLSRQGDTLVTMRQVFDQVKEDPRAELIEALEQQMQELEQRYREANTCIDIMQQENERLQEKIDRKEDRIEQVKAEKNESVNDLAEQVDRQKRNIGELQDMVGELQLEAGKAEQLQAKLDQFDLASRDMNMCIQVLEEENAFLQEQIKALLQAEDGGSVYDKTDETGDSEALQQEIAGLKNQLQEKEQKISEVEARYASMEKEYLTLYEEAQSS